MLQSLPSVTAPRREHGGLHASPLCRAVLRRRLGEFACSCCSSGSVIAARGCLILVTNTPGEAPSCHAARRVIAALQRITSQPSGSGPPTRSASRRHCRQHTASALAPAALRREASRRRLQLAGTPEETSAAKCWSLDAATLSFLLPQAALHIPGLVMRCLGNSQPDASPCASPAGLDAVWVATAAAQRSAAQPRRLRLLPAPRRHRRHALPCGKRCKAIICLLALAVHSLFRNSPGSVLALLLARPTLVALLKKSAPRRLRGDSEGVT